MTTGLVGVAVVWQITEHTCKPSQVEEYINSNPRRRHAMTAAALAPVILGHLDVNPHLSNAAIGALIKPYLSRPLAPSSSIPQNARDHAKKMMFGDPEVEVLKLRSLQISAEAAGHYFRVVVQSGLEAKAALRKLYEGRHDRQEETHAKADAGYVKKKFDEAKFDREHSHILDGEMYIAGWFVIFSYAIAVGKTRSCPTIVATDAAHLKLMSGVAINLVGKSAGGGHYHFGYAVMLTSESKAAYEPFLKAAFGRVCGLKRSVVVKDDHPGSAAAINSVDPDTVVFQCSRHMGPRVVQGGCAGDAPLYKEAVHAPTRALVVSAISRMSAKGQTYVQKKGLKSLFPACCPKALHGTTTSNWSEQDNSAMGQLRRYPDLFSMAVALFFYVEKKYAKERERALAAQSGGQRWIEEKYASFKTHFEDAEKRAREVASAQISNITDPMKPTLKKALVQTKNGGSQHYCVECDEHGEVTCTCGVWRNTGKFCWHMAKYFSFFGLDPWEGGPHPPCCRSFFLQVMSNVALMPRLPVIFCSYCQVFGFVGRQRGQSSTRRSLSSHGRTTCRSITATTLR